MKYRKKPVVIEAEQYDSFNSSKTPFYTKAVCKKAHDGIMGKPHIHTLEGTHSFSHGDWIIQGVKGEFYACKPDIFEMTYEKVEEV